MIAGLMTVIAGIAAMIAAPVNDGRVATTDKAAAWQRVFELIKADQGKYLKQDAEAAFRVRLVPTRNETSDALLWAWHERGPVNAGLSISFDRASNSESLTLDPGYNSTPITCLTTAAIARKAEREGWSVSHTSYGSSDFPGPALDTIFTVSPVLIIIVPTAEPSEHCLYVRIVRRRVKKPLL